MTNHPITPPPELVQKWWDNVPGTFTHLVDETELATQAAQWGADQELEACCEWLKKKTNYRHITIEFLRDARRPKPPTLKEQALEALEALPTPAGQVTADRLDTIRRALEALDD
jgi:hypothetical protein